jgi:hypothetical protein
MIGVLVALVVVAAPMVYAQGRGGAPTPVDTEPIDLDAGAVFGNCDFPVQLQYSGKGKQIELPDGSFIATAPGLKATLTNVENGNQETFSITGSFRVSTDPATGDVKTVSRGRSLLGDPVAGFVIASGNYSFIINDQGTTDAADDVLVQPLTGKGKLIDVCEALA